MYALYSIYTKKSIKLSILVKTYALYTTKGSNPRVKGCYKSLQN